MAKKITLLCDYCDNSFKRRYSYHKWLVEKRGVTRKYCSPKCKSLAQEFAIDNDDIKERYLSGESTIEIGNSLGLSWGTIRNRLLKMGVEIRPRTAHLLTDKNPTKGKGHTEEAKEKIRKANQRQFSNPKNRELAAHNQRLAIANGKVSTTSKLEDAVAIELDNLGIQYERQRPIRNPKNGQYCACVDFLLPNSVILEVNGSFWHADPRLYPNGPEKAAQKRTVENDKKKKEILIELGFSIIEVWGLDVRENPSKAVLDKISSILPSLKV